MISHLWQAIFIPRVQYQELTSFIQLIRSIKELTGSLYGLMFNLYKDQAERVNAFETITENSLLGYYSVDIASSIILGRSSLM